MKPARALITLIAVTFSGIAADCSAHDRLFQVDAQYDFLKQYRRIRDEKLSITPFDCGRVIVQPPVQPEYSVSVYSHQRRGDEDCHVTFVACDTSLWQTTEMGHHAEVASHVKTTRIDAPLPVATAKQLRELWRRSLSGGHGPIPLSAEHIASTDSIEAEFSLQVPKRTVLEGIILDTSNGPSTGLTGASVAVSRDLVRYCRSSPHARPAVLLQINNRVAATIGEPPLTQHGNGGRGQI
jgi:hypothetical protein